MRKGTGIRDYNLCFIKNGNMQRISLFIVWMQGQNNIITGWTQLNDKENE